MQSLDEVIKTLEDAIDATDADCPMMTLFEGDATDVLHYLKEYQRDKDELDSTRLAYLDILTDYVALKNFWAEQQANPPLTWDELKQIEGKPVFLEQYWYPMEDEEGVTEDEVEIDKYWAIIDNVQAKRIHFVGKRLIMGMTISDLDPNKSGGWQAFRKERR